MLLNYFKIAWRNILKYKMYSSINIFGLALGLASFLLVLLFLKNEYSYDQFHANKAQIYRVDHKDWAILGTAFGDKLRENFPEVQDAARFDTWTAGSAIIKHDTDIHKINDFVFADASALDMFTLPLVRGNQNQALRDPLSIVLDETTARRIFDDENPIGQVLRYNNQFNFTVTGIMQDVRNSHIPMHAIASFISLTQIYNDSHFLEKLDGWNHPTFVQLHAGTDITELEEKINIYFSQFSSYFWTAEEGSQFHLVPLNDIYFHDTAKFSYGLHGSMQSIYLVSALAIFMLLIACFNFINLTTARAAIRSREVGVRKVLGAFRTRLIGQMLSESIVMCALAFITALGLTRLALPFFNAVFSTSLTLHNFNMTEFIGVSLFSILVLGIAAGIYPAVQLTSFNPATILKASKNKDRRAVFFRRVLTGFQFALSVMLIIGTMVLAGQLQFLKNKNMGFDKSHVLIVPVNNEIRQHWQVFKNRLVSTPGIENVTFSHFTLGHVGWIQTWQTESGELQSNLLHVDPEFVPFMNLEIIDGRNLNWDAPADARGSFIINEEMASSLPPGPIIGRKLDEGTIVGVVKNFHFNSLRNKITPLVMAWGSNNMRFANIKITPQHTQSALHQIETIWQEMAPNFPFEFSFLDKQINDIYKSEQRLSLIFSTFSTMALVIACIGLFGLSAFLVVHRTREIALHKIFGASGLRILLKLSTEFSMIVLAANLIAWPIIYFAAHKMLQDFAYHIDLTIWPFVTAALATLAIALLTISWQTIRAATANPVEALRYE